MATSTQTTSPTDRSASGAYTVPGLGASTGRRVADILQGRLNALNDLMLTLKHVHWNVVGPHFIAVHEMIDPHVDEVRAMVDETAERIATLGESPMGTPAYVVDNRSWDDYTLARGTTNEHLGALDVVYNGLLGDHRDAQRSVADQDPVTEDMIIGQLRQLELFQWFIRAHLETTDGALTTDGASTEGLAATRASHAAD